MIQKFARRSVPVFAFVLALAVSAVHATAQTKSTTTTTTTTTTPGTATPQGVTGGDPQPIRWPPSLNMSLRVK